MNQIVHSKHPVPKEVAEGLLSHAEQEAAAAAQQFELSKLARPTAEERNLRTGVYESLFRSTGIDVDKYRSQSSSIAKQQFDRINRSDLASLNSYSDITPMDFEPPEPRGPDPSFWAADMEMFGTAPFTREIQADGLDFRGKKTYDGGDLISLVFGEKSRYELHANRVPRPERPPWRSAPHVELFGELMAWTGSRGLFYGDRWSKCWMIRRQTLFQFVFGPSGPVARTIGEATDLQTVFFEENQGRTVFHRLSGFQPMPQLVLNSIFPGISIWAELEVRFDTQLEGNSLFWIHPFDLLVRGFQWPLEPL